MDIFVDVIFAELRVVRHFPPISALLGLSIATDNIHRHLYAFQGGKNGEHYWKRAGLPFRHTCIRLCYECMYPIVIIVKSLTHYIVMISMRFYSCPYR